MPADDVDKLLAEQKAFEDRKQKLIDDLLKERAAAVKEFDDKLAKLGYKSGTGGDGAGKSRRSHHRKAATPAPAKG
jgi:hypothetical protein